MATAATRPAARFGSPRGGAGRRTGRRAQARRRGRAWRLNTEPLKRVECAARRASELPLRLRLGAEGVHLFGWCAFMLAVAFGTALLYLRFATAVTAGGYDMHELTANRDELRRQVQLLQLQALRLDSPPRIEDGAKALGMEKAAKVTVITSGSMVAGR